MRRPRLDGGAARHDLFRHRLRVRHQEAEMRDAEARLVTFLAAVERLDRHVGVAVADVLVAIAGALARFRMRLEHLAEAEHADVEGEDRLGVECVERHVRDARNARGPLAQSEIGLRERDRVAFRIEDAYFAVLEVAALRDHRAARIERAIARDHRIHIVDGDAEMMDAVFHARLVQRRPVLEQREIEAAVGERHVAVGGTVELLKRKMRLVEMGERRRLRAQQSQIADARHVPLSVSSREFLHFSLPASNVGWARQGCVRSVDTGYSPATFTHSPFGFFMSRRMALVFQSMHVRTSLKALKMQSSRLTILPDKFSTALTRTSLPSLPRKNMPIVHI